MLTNKQLWGRERNGKSLRWERCTCSSFILYVNENGSFRMKLFSTRHQQPIKGPRTIYTLLRRPSGKYFQIHTFFPGFVWRRWTFCGLAWAWTDGFHCFPLWWYQRTPASLQHTTTHGELSTFRLYFSAAISLSSTTIIISVVFFLRGFPTTTHIVFIYYI